MTPQGSAEPETHTGRQLAKAIGLDYDRGLLPDWPDPRDLILAIEAEAREALDKLRAFYGIDVLHEIGVSSNREMELWRAVDVALAEPAARAEPRTYFCDYWLDDGSRSKCPATATINAADRYGAPLRFCEPHWQRKEHIAAQYGPGVARAEPLPGLPATEDAVHKARVNTIALAMAQERDLPNGREAVVTPTDIHNAEWVVEHMKWPEPLPGLPEIDVARLAKAIHAWSHFDQEEECDAYMDAKNIAKLYADGSEHPATATTDAELRAAATPEAGGDAG